MTRRIDIVVRTTTLTPFRRLLTSLDRQTVDASEFGVVCVRDGLDPQEADQLATLAAYRPNLQVVDAGSSWWAVGLDASEAAHVLPLDESDQFLANGLPRLLEAADAGATTVLGRAVAPGWTTPWHLFAGKPVDAASYDGVDPRVLPVLLGAQEAASTSGRSGLADIRRDALTQASDVHVLAGQPLLRSQPHPRETSADPQLTTCTATWAAGLIEVTVSGLDTADPVDLVVVRNVVSAVDWQLRPHQLSPDGFAVRVDPLTEADGEPLSKGRWVVDVVFASGGLTRLSVMTAPGNALLGGQPVAGVRGTKGRLVLDVGATKRSPLLGIDPAAAIIVESARGTRLVWPLPFAAVTGDGSYPAKLRLGDFPIAAELTVADGEARLEAWLSGVYSTVSVAASLAGSPWHPTACDLHIELAGEMRLVRSKLARPAATSKETQPPHLQAGLAHRARSVAGRALRKARSLRPLSQRA